MFKHKELQQQLMDTKLQRITEMMKEVEEKQQKERDLVSGSSRQFKAATPEAGGPTVPGAAWLLSAHQAPDVVHHKYTNTSKDDMQM